MADFDHRSLDEVIHGRVRLGLMAYLRAAGAADFTDLKRRLGVSDGNLSTHLKKLEQAGYVAADKRFVGRKPQTRVRLTETGRAAFAAYLETLEGLLGSGD